LVSFVKIIFFCLLIYVLKTKILTKQPKIQNIRKPY